MPGPQRDMRVRDLAELDAIDKQVIAILSRDGRTTNADLAAALGVAPSTAHTRMRSLVDRGIITGFHASVDHQRLGRGLQAMIGVALRPGARHDSIVAFADEVRKLPPEAGNSFTAQTRPASRAR